MQNLFLWCFRLVSCLSRNIYFESPFSTYRPFFSCKLGLATVSVVFGVTSRFVFAGSLYSIFMSWLHPVSAPVHLGSQIGSSSAFRAVSEQRGAPVTPVLNCSASIETLTRGSNCIPFAAAVIPSSSLAGVTVDFTSICLGLNFGIVFEAEVLDHSVAVVRDIFRGSCPRPLSYVGF
jgi:hypothetical protein